MTNSSWKIAFTSLALVLSFAVMSPSIAAKKDWKNSSFTDCVNRCNNNPPQPCFDSSIKGDRAKQKAIKKHCKEEQKMQQQLM